jgi:hypothetical protein
MRARVAVLVGVAAMFAGRAGAADWEVGFLAGSAFPTYDERLSIRVPPIGSAPGIDVTGGDDFVLEANGGLVLGATVAWEFGGFFAIEGRVDSARVDLETTGTTYRFAVDVPGVPPVNATVAAGPGDIALERLFIYSGNLRLRTPGPVSFYASGGLSYLPSLRADSALPVRLDAGGLPLGDIRGSLALVAEPSESESRVGFNGGAGLRVSLGSALAVFAEARVFVFDSYDLRFDVEGSPELRLLDSAVQSLPPIRFDPILYNIAGGLIVRF